MKKKLIVLALTTFMFSLVACSNNKGEEVPPKNDKPIIQVATETVEETEEVKEEEPVDVKEETSKKEDELESTSLNKIDETESSVNYESMLNGYWINNTENAIVYINVAEDNNTENTFKLYFDNSGTEVYKFAPFVIKDEHTIVLGADMEEYITYTLDGDRVTIETDGCIIPFVRGTEEEYNEIFDKYYNA